MSTADAVTRETAWLTAVDALPTLLKPAGPWDLVAAYWSPTRGTRQRRLFVTRAATVERRFAAHRKIDTYTFVLKAFWPVGTGTVAAGMWETEQAAFDTALDAVVARIRQTTGDHTHGTFLSVAEAPEGATIDVRYEDPEKSFATSPAELRATVTYLADDNDFTA